MNKELITKAQKITPKKTAQATQISDALTIKADNDLALEKKGTLYGVFDITNQNPLDNSLVTKVVNDVIHDMYFQAESVSPIQSIEKAILKLRDSLTDLAKTQEKDSTVTFNIATAILWGNTLYLVQYGNTNTYLMRAGTIKPIEAATEGKFSVASGVIKNNDVVILATAEFSKKHPPKKLISASTIVAEELAPLESSLILKFNVDETFSKDERIHFGTPKNTTSDTSTDAKKIESLENITTKEKPKQKSTLKVPGLKDAPKEKIGITTKVSVVFGVLLSVVLVAILFTRQEDPETYVDQATNETTENQETMETTEETIIEIDPEEDLVNKVERVKKSVFYDIKLVNQDADASDIVVINDMVVVTNKKTGAIYTSNTQTPKFSPFGPTFGGISNLQSFDGELVFSDITGFKSVDIKTGNTTEEFYSQDLGPAARYLGFIYVITNDILTKNVKSGDELTQSTWAQTSNLEGAVSVAIDSSIYVLKENELLKFTRGKQDDFELSGLDKELSRAVQVLTNIELENIYIADSGNNRILILNKDGKLIKQLKLEEEMAWNDIRGIAITNDETTLFVLNGTTVYDIVLE